MRRDKTITLGKSILQHGPLNDRIYLMDYRADNTDEREQLWKEIQKIQEKENYSKHFLKIPSEESPFFRAQGYSLEAVIPGYYNPRRDAHLMTRYFSDQRTHFSDEDRENLENISSLRESAPSLPAATPPSTLPPEIQFSFRPLGRQDLRELASLFRMNFASYPFPIFDPDYLEETLDDNVEYWGAFHEGKLVGASSAEKNPSFKNAEMTDFAVNPGWRGYALARRLLIRMENSLAEQDFFCLYTIARLCQPGMNKTFMKQGYIYGGTLINNTQIGGSLESMNIWYRHLAHIKCPKP